MVSTPHESNPHGLKLSWFHLSWLQTLMDLTFMAWNPHEPHPHGLKLSTLMDQTLMVWNPYGYPSTCLLIPSSLLDASQGCLIEPMFWKHTPHGSTQSNANFTPDECLRPLCADGCHRCCSTDGKQIRSIMMKNMWKIIR